MRTHTERIKVGRMKDSRYWTWECGEWFGYGRSWYLAMAGALRHHKLHHERIGK